MRTPSNPGLRTLGLIVLAAMASVGAGGFTSSAQAGSAYFTYADIHGDRIVFCAESDLWIAGSDGSSPQRLTTDDGSEYFPSFSPDGQWIAFTGLYDGNNDVYLISAQGGEPKRLTWHPAGDEVVGWMPDGKRVIFRSTRNDPHGTPHLFTVDLKGSDPQEIPLGWASRLAVDPATGMYAFNRQTRERASWKRYRGGSASDIWVGDPDRADYKQVTDFEGMDLFPMWHEGRIWFLSDQGGTANIWSIEPDGTDRKQHTDLKEWDARWAAMGPDGRIIFTKAADIHVFDPATGQVRKIDIDLPSDRTLTRTRYPDPDRAITWFDLSPEGDRVAVVARGEIFSVPVKDGVTLPVTRGTGAREFNATFDPKGERILYVTDEPREEEFRTIDAWGRGKPDVVKKAGKGGWHHAPVWSPDGEWIAYADNSYGLFVMPAKGGKPIEVDRSTQGEIPQYSFSPDGRWLAYVKLLPTDYYSIFIYDTKEKQIHEVTGPFTTDFSPAWDPDGRYLYFGSERATNPLVGLTDWNNVEFKHDMLYMLLLRKDVKNPLAHLAGLPPEDDKNGDKDKEDGKGGKDEKDKKKGDEAADAKDEKDKEKDKDKKDEKPEPVEIDFDGLADRIVELPVDRGNYGDLAATSGGLFFVSQPIQGMAEQAGLFQESGPIATLMLFDMEKKKADTFMDGISGYVLADKGEKVAVMKQRGELYVTGAAAAPGPDLSESKVDFSDVVVELDPREEWAQIFYEAWRQVREYYWDEKMSGLDWDAIRDQYAKLLPRVASRADLSDLIGQLYGEANTSHNYIFGGDFGVRPTRVSTGLLGADLVREGQAYKVAKIYRGDPADRVRSPLDEPGVNVAEGEYILAVNRLPLSGDRSIHSYLANLAGKEVLLTVNDKPSLDGSREVVVVPLGNEGELRYSDWVRTNRAYVAEKTDGKIGYIHIPDMWTDGLVEFNTWFYPQLDKEGMIVDVRWNGGGAVSQQILERFRRHVLSFNLARGGGQGTYPYRTLNGPFVVLTNEFAGSDGDIFPQAVQLEKLAPVIGIRSWGGVVGIASLRPLVDGGLVTQSQSAWWDPRDGWNLENRGVIPDIVVQNLPQEMGRNQDSQLDRGIAEVMKLHREHPPLEPKYGPIRDRSRRAFRNELGK
jgi:tricorn protease